jgi:hypothetical protein
MKRLAVIAIVTACGTAPPRVPLDDTWPAHVGNYLRVTETWTRHAQLHGEYQQVLDLEATFLSPEWHAAHARRDADNRGLEGEARQARVMQAQADAAGPYEIELLVTTWDRHENDLDKGKRSVWRVVLVDDSGLEIEPLEIVKDKRPTYIVRAEFPALRDFANAYIAKFPRKSPVLGPHVHRVRLRMSSERGGVEVAWEAP